MNAEFFDALALLEKEKGIAADYLLEKICNAIAIAAKRDYGSGDNIIVEADSENKNLNVYLRKKAVAEVESPDVEILVSEAKKYRPHARAGSVIDIPLKTMDFGRIAAQTAKHVIRQSIREAERNQVFEELQGKQGEIISATVIRVDPRRGSAIFEVGKTEAVLPRSEQIPDEGLYEGGIVKVYVVDVTVTERGPKVMISRTHPGLVKRLFEMEVPEIFDGVVEIRGISREAGMRTKVAVYSTDENVDPRGACIGPRGSRVARIVDELGGEKIDIVLWSDDPMIYIAEALSPANVVEVNIIDPEAKICRAMVPDDQLSLAIGNKGQNARLAARLTGYKIDIRPESGYYGEEP
ncbi:MAG: transcription termination factor NusA [Oscillospiraceae bacterium]|nr:transcription termination factor NusA [Oscillospiraceae bacterium]